MQKIRHYIRILNKRFHYTSKYGILIQYLLLSYILLSCGKPKESNRNMVKLSFDKMCLLSDEIYSDSILAVILYYDSLSCTSCVFKDLYLWKKLLKKHKNIQICTIWKYPISRIKELEMAYKVDNISIPLYVDTADVFYCQNKVFFEALKAGKALLIDKDKKTVLFKGYPLRNKKDKKVFLATVKEFINL